MATNRTEDDGIFFAYKVVPRLFMEFAVNAVANHRGWSDAKKRSFEEYVDRVSKHFRGPYFDEPTGQWLFRALNGSRSDVRGVFRDEASHAGDGVSEDERLLSEYLIRFCDTVHPAETDRVVQETIAAKKAKVARPAGDGKKTKRKAHDEEEDEADVVLRHHPWREELRAMIVAHERVRGPASAKEHKRNFTGLQGFWSRDPVVLSLIQYLTRLYEAMHQQGQKRKR
jgi:hypothetical protein